MEEYQEVTLLIKATNQQIDDHTVKCNRSWTIKQLKEHLSGSYPTTPKTSQQRLIFSGKLLQDDVTLIDVLKNYPNVSTHTIHLVSSGLLTGTTPTMPMYSNSANQGTVNPPTNAEPPPTQPDQWRQYMHNYHNLYSGYWGPYHNQYYTSTRPYLRTGHMTTMQQFASSQYASQQYAMVMRQIYTNHYINHYMQYYRYGQLGGLSQQPMPTAPVVNQVAALPDHAPNVDPVAPVVENGHMNNAPHGLAANQNLVMNAQGGQMEEDDEIGRDWLDWSYTLCRFAILLTIIYFYSTFSRFIAVMLLFVLFYVYQNGYFRLMIHAAIPPAPVEPAAPPAAQPQDEHHPPQPQEALDGHAQHAAPDHADPTEPVRHADTDEPRTIVDPPLTPRTDNGPGVLYMAWCFISSFFTSLFPQRPPEVNAN